MNAQSDRRHPARTDEHDDGPADLRISAFAKVNLSLEILGRRPDGFHEIVSVTQIVSLADTVTVTAGDTLSVAMDPPLVGEVDNLARNAALALAAEADRTPTGAVRIVKRIPLAAGLGGGSSDAAATLRLLDGLWQTRLHRDHLARIAAALGSDVPLFLGGGLSLISGRGEIVEPLEPVAPFGLLLIYPGGAPPDKTRALYRALGPTDFGDGSATRSLVDWLRAGRPIDEAALVNGFDAAADRVYPGFARLRAEMADLLRRPVHLSGAGPTLFTVFAHPHDARSAAAKVRRPGLTTFVARSVTRRASIRRLTRQNGRTS